MVSRLALPDKSTTFSLGPLSISHMDFGAIAFELHLVHQLVNQVDTAAVVGEHVFAVAGIGDSEGIAAVVAHQRRLDPSLSRSLQRRKRVLQTTAGYLLINQLMDEVKFERNGTEIHMRKY